MFVTSLHDIAYEIIELYRATYKVTDSLDIRQVKSWIHNYRAFLLHQKFMRPMSMIDYAYRQDLGILKLELVDSSLLPGFESGKHMVRTIEDIPSLIEDNRKLPVFTRLSVADRFRRNINHVTYERALVSGNGRFNSNDLFAFLFDSKIYLISKEEIYYKGISHLHAEGVFEDVTTAAKFKNSDYTDKDPYPITKAMLSDIHRLIASEKFPLVMTQLKDNISDDADNLVNIQSQNRK